ncbi:MAG: DUF134 domain-containing protein [archaeon]
MVRSRRCRWIQNEPNVTYFKPAGARISHSEIIELQMDEYEALRLKHIKKLDQEKAAEKMNISQPTFHRLLESAHEKITIALTKGIAIKIKGGDYMTEEERKGVAKRDGSGEGRRANRGRGGCEPPQDKGTDFGPGRRCPRGRGRRRGPPA